MGSVCLRSWCRRVAGRVLPEDRKNARGFESVVRRPICLLRYSTSPQAPSAAFLGLPQGLERRCKFVLDGQLFQSQVKSFARNVFKGPTQGFGGDVPGTSNGVNELPELFACICNDENLSDRLGETADDVRAGVCGLVFPKDGLELVAEGFQVRIPQERIELLDVDVELVICVVALVVGSDGRITDRGVLSDRCAYEEGRLEGTLAAEGFAESKKTRKAGRGRIDEPCRRSS